MVQKKLNMDIGKIKYYFPKARNVLQDESNILLESSVVELLTSLILKEVDMYRGSQKDIARSALKRTLKLARDMITNDGKGNRKNELSLIKKRKRNGEQSSS